ncbi:GNAT family N-acetyltransferase [Streptomyces sp. NPDC017940]|uniref:GNAT family N-acetyltransferase n=1 Tax=Streptomyces sp. NPDC017940 TaxID=3365017 RepID=UPI00378A26B3
MTPDLRRAKADDVAELVRMRSTLLLSRPVDAHWTAVLTEDLRERLTNDPLFAAFVIDAPDGRGLVSSALGMAYRVLPGPRYPKGLAGRVHAVATESAYRRRGYATAVTSALVDWFRDRDCTLFEVYAKGDSAGLYRALGFEADPACMRMSAVLPEC